MWGQACVGYRYKITGRIIPTRVGTRVSDDMTFLKKEDHPHACGDKKNLVISARILGGSSPRVWGQGPSVFSIARISGIIPTRVGTRHPIGYLRTAEKDHPHACGDKDILKILISITEGSSPRVWGQENIVLYGIRKTGIIPTRVGTRLDFFGRTTSRQDHPHACGDKTGLEYVPICLEGSSPRVWGQVVVSEFGMPSCGIIPTRVGTSSAGRKRQLLGEDHPHACGDKRKKNCLQKSKHGSSPRVWGQVIKNMMEISL